MLVATLNRPDQMNALDASMIAGIASAAATLTSDPALSALLVTARGRAFCAGADLIEARELLASPARFRQSLYSWRDAFRALEKCEKPVVALVDGLALAGGLELALACDLIVATDRARFGDGHISYGLVPGGGGSKRLCDAIGTRNARWLMYSGTMVDAAEAKQLGLVQQVIASGDRDSWIDEFAASLGSRSVPALSFMKSMTRSKRVTDDDLEHEIEAAVHVVTSADAREGLAAFQEKRSPVFPSLREAGEQC